VRQGRERRASDFPARPPPARPGHFGVAGGRRLRQRRRTMSIPPSALVGLAFWVSESTIARKRSGPGAIDLAAFVLLGP